MVGILSSIFLWIMVGSGGCFDLLSWEGLGVI